jgi:hypothetical protein
MPIRTRVPNSRADPADKEPNLSLEGLSLVDVVLLPCGQSCWVDVIDDEPAIQVVNLMLDVPAVSPRFISSCVFPSLSR